VLVAALALTGCTSTTTVAGDDLTNHTTTVAGMKRTWLEYRPPALGRVPVPVVIALHGLGGRATDMVTATGLDAEARADGFMAVYPQALRKAWNAGDCCGLAATTGVPDLEFLYRVIDDLIARGVADQDRVYVAGLSNGAMMALRLACTPPTHLAGAAVVAGTMTAPCPPHRPLDLLVIHQTGDGVVPFDGTTTPLPVLGDRAPLPSVHSSVSRWLASIGCDTRPAVRPPVPALPVEQSVWTCPGPSRTELDAITGGTHSWPRSPAAPLDATTRLAEFFNLRP